MISTILLAVIMLVLIYRCYINETNMINLSIKHNELAKIVQNNAIILNTVVDEINQIIEEYNVERGEIVDEN